MILSAFGTLQRGTCLTFKINFSSFCCKHSTISIGQMSMLRVVRMNGFLELRTFQTEDPALCFSVLY